jgi:hypothetical protein
LKSRIRNCKVGRLSNKILKQVKTHQGLLRRLKEEKKKKKKKKEKREELKK